MTSQTRTTSATSTCRGRRRVQRLALTGAATLGLALAVAPTAVADPVREPLALQCDVLGPVTITVPADAPYTPGLVAGSTRVGIPYSLTVTSTFTPTGGTPRTVVESYSRPAPAHDRHDRCTFHAEGGDAAGSYVVDGVALITYTPR